jgi:hypothetical protein
MTNQRFYIRRMSWEAPTEWDDIVYADSVDRWEYECQKSLEYSKQRRFRAKLQRFIVPIIILLFLVLFLVRF